MKNFGFRIGGTVVALCHITEDDFPRPGLIHEHAAPGDHGVITMPGRDVGWVSVRWKRTGTETVCHISELRNAAN